MERTNIRVLSGWFQTLRATFGCVVPSILIFILHVELAAIRRTTKIVSEYDQEIPQSQTADNPVAPRGRAAQPSRGTRKINQAKQPALSSPSR